MTTSCLVDSDRRQRAAVDSAGESSCGLVLGSASSQKWRPAICWARTGGSVQPLTAQKRRAPISYLLGSRRRRPGVCWARAGGSVQLSTAQERQACNPGFGQLSKVSFNHFAVYWAQAGGCGKRRRRTMTTI
ncbi:hypothetical protein L7F22_057071 [Adiantum nelumboides]|nr:hypothetical protein [Adiantum nelumboides]